MHKKLIRVAVVVGLMASLAPFQASPAAADHALPPLDPSQIDYTPIGYWGPPDEQTVPEGVTGSARIPETPPDGEPLEVGPNPSGKWVAYDTNVYEALSFPGRHPGDTCNSLPEDQQHPSCRAGDMDPDPPEDQGTGYRGPNGYSPVHGECPPSPGFPSGECFNNQLEWLDHYEASMEEMLADMGVVVHRYPFDSPGRSDGGTERGAPGGTDSGGGQAYNISATIPGVDHPEETVLVSGHYDFTDGGPAAAWDSAEGHTEVMRMAYIMADYYRKTGTRPSATIKFIPWDSEESGTFGSIDYVRNNIPPDEQGQPREDLVRGYFNVDPCAGAYPAFKEGTAFQQQVPEVMQLANPANWDEQPEIKARIEAFNALAETIPNQVFEYLDDSITTPEGEVPIFVSDAEETAGNDGTQDVDASDRDQIATAVGGLAIFSSDYANFEGIGVPIFNLFPDLFGPHADDTPASAEGIAILHTPQDNLPRLNRLTSALTDPGEAPDPTGLFASEGWAKGMEMCSQMNSWFMLQPEMVGAQTATDDPLAYYEALPNDALINQNVTFDANGSYQYANVGQRTFVDEDDLAFQRNFGDGTTGNGKVVQHAYDEVGMYESRLTVRNTVTGDTDTMTIPIRVIGSNFAGPILAAIDQEDAADGTFPLNWDFTANRAGFQRFSVQESTDFETIFTDDASDIALNWDVTPAENAALNPWQPSDSSTPKLRQNQAHSAPRSFWAGVSPQNWEPQPPLSQNTLLTLKEPITVPDEGDVGLSYWSLYQSEGDDQGRVEVALDDGDPTTDPVWEPVDIVQVQNTALGGNDPHVCDPSTPDQTLTQGFENRSVDLSSYQGRDVLIRFNYTLGSEDRVVSQPCGWYVDDVRLGAGSFAGIGSTTEETFQVEDRANGTYAYRVFGVYNDGVRTAASNIELAEVTEGGGGPGDKCRGYASRPGNHVVGSSDDETLRGTSGRDVLCGRGGDDTLRGFDGQDLLLGGPGDDRGLGGSGADEARGGGGADTLQGGDGGDDLFGNAGPDLLNGNAGRDSCAGGPGNDTEHSCET